MVKQTLSYYRKAVGALWLALVLSGCSPTITPPSYPSSEAVAARDLDRSVCFDTWLNSGVSTVIIDAGISDGVLTTTPDDGLLHADWSAQHFDRWKADYDTPWSEITQAILWGPGCPFTRLDEELLAMNEKAIECLGHWLHDYAPQDVISTGVNLGTLSPDPKTGQYYANVDHENFKEWVVEEVEMPWGDIRAEVVYGNGCPFGL